MQKSISQADGFACDELPSSLKFHPDAFYIPPDHVQRAYAAGIMGKNQCGETVYLPLPEPEDDGA